MKAKLKENTSFDILQVNSTKIFFTPFGTLTARPGDWAMELIKEGQVVVFNDDTFKTLFELVEEINTPDEEKTNEENETDDVS